MSEKRTCVCGQAADGNEVECNGLYAFDYKFSYCGDVKCRNKIIDLMIQDLKYDYRKLGA